MVNRISSETSSLSLAVRDAVDEYLQHLDGAQATDLYALVLREVERPLLECALHHSHGNQSKAATLLGVSRTTLRKKLQDHGLT